MNDRTPFYDFAAAIAAYVSSPEYQGGRWRVSFWLNGRRYSRIVNGRTTAIAWANYIERQELRPEIGRIGGDHDD